MDADSRALPVSKERETEKLEFGRRTDRALLAVDDELHLFPFQIVDARLHHPLGGPRGADIYVDIVRITDETQTSGLQKLVESVKVDIRERWRQRPALRGASIGRHDEAIGKGGPAPQEPLDEFQQGPVPDIPAQDVHEDVLVDGVEELRQVQVHDPDVSLVVVRPRTHDCIVRAPAWSESEAVVREHWVINRCQNLRHRLL